MCVHQLAKEAAKRGHDVTTICYEDGDETSAFDDVKAIKISIPGFLRENGANSTLINRINQIRSVFSKLIHIRKYPLRSLSVVKRYCNELEKLIVEGETTIVASVNPLEAVVAAAQIKQRYGSKVKTVYYCADTLSNEKGNSGILPPEYRTKCGIKWEKKLFDYFDKVLIMECHQQHYYSDVFIEYRNKFSVVNFPLFTNFEMTETSTCNKSDGRIKCVYAGSLYRKLRNPEYLISILNNAMEIVDMEVYFLGSSDCEELIHRTVRETDGQFFYLGMQPHEIALEYIGSADVLLSIGNVESPMAPSKIYEYMSTGKPIVHVYSYDEDPCILPLSQYGNALLIKQGSKEGPERLIHFLEKRRVLDNKIVKQMFITSVPEYTISVMEQ